MYCIAELADEPEPALTREHESDTHEGNGALPEPACITNSSPRGDTMAPGERNLY